jgi:hypothetical protein
MKKRDTTRSASTANVVSGREANIDDAAISALIEFFKLLDKWDREAKRQ